MTIKYYRNLLVICILVFILIAFPIQLKADTFSFDWVHINFNLVHVLANSDYLSSNWWNGSVYTNGLSKWNSSAASLYISDTNYYNANLDIVSLSETEWINRGWDKGFVAYAQPWDGTTRCSLDPFEDPGDNCDFADKGTIYINLRHYFQSLDERSAIIAHEIGHIVGLAHTSNNTTSSIMQTPVEHDYFSNTPTTYDINEFNNKY